MWLLDWALRLFELRKKAESHLVALGKDWYRYSKAKRDSQV